MQFIYDNNSNPYCVLLFSRVLLLLVSERISVHALRNSMPKMVLVALNTEGRLGVLMCMMQSARRCDTAHFIIHLPLCLLWCTTSQISALRFVCRSRGCTGCLRSRRTKKRASQSTTVVFMPVQFESRPSYGRYRLHLHNPQAACR